MPAIPPPALGAVRQRRLTNRKLAMELEYSETWVCRVLLGQAPAPAEFRARLARLLALPEQELFPKEISRAC